MAKLLLVIGVTILLVLWFKSLARRGRDAEDKPENRVEDMVRCRVCGVNLPRSEAILSQERIYCCDEHRRRDRG